MHVRVTGDILGRSEMEENEDGRSVTAILFSHPSIAFVVVFLTGNNSLHFDECLNYSSFSFACHWCL